MMDDTSNKPSAMGTLSPFFKIQSPLEALPHDQETGAPTFMQRQKSSVIDVTAFSFAKPGSRQGGFSLKALPKQSFIDRGPETTAAPDKEAQNRNHVLMMERYVLVTP